MNWDDDVYTEELQRHCLGRRKLARFQYLTIKKTIMHYMKLVGQNGIA